MGENSDEDLARLVKDDSAAGVADAEMRDERAEAEGNTNGVLLDSQDLLDMVDRKGIKVIAKENEVQKPYEIKSG